MGGASRIQFLCVISVNFARALTRQMTISEHRPRRGAALRTQRHVVSGETRAALLQRRGPHARQPEGGHAASQRDARATVSAPYLALLELPPHATPGPRSKESDKSRQILTVKFLLSD